MKKSVQKRVAFTFIILMTAVLIAIGVFEAFFINSFYTSEKMRKLRRSWSLMNEIGDGEITDSFRRFCSANGLIYCVADENLREMESNAENGELMQGRLFGNILGMEDDNTRVIEENDSYRLIEIRDRFSSMEYLELWGKIENGDYYIVYTPMESIRDAASISMKFYLCVGIPAIIIGAIIIWVIAKRVVEPLKELSEQSKRMAELDFNARYTGKSEDEIGELGRNFNSMADKLEKAVGELKSANAKLEKDIAEKTQIDEMRKDFLANVSHELKTPIALISGYAEGLKDNVNDDPESRDFYCDVIIDESSKMNKMVHQLLTLNRLEFGNEKMDMARFDLTELISGVISSLKVMIDDAKAQIRFDSSHPVYVWGDEFAIEEVVTNYLTNALHHLDGERIVEIRCEEKDGIVTTTVFNSGQPIPKDSIDRIWDKFYKVDKARSRQYGGSGIGLSIVKAIMDRHQQKCWVKNFDNGVAFSFTLESKADI